MTVLEARGRTGGRIHSVSMGSNIVDMGASWIHGIGPGAGDLSEYDGKMNPIYDLANEFGISTVSTWSDVDDVEESYYWWKQQTTPLDITKVENLGPEIRDHVTAKADTASVS